LTRIPNLIFFYIFAFFLEKAKAVSHSVWKLNHTIVDVAATLIVCFAELIKYSRIVGKRESHNICRFKACYAYWFGRIWVNASLAENKTYFFWNSWEAYSLWYVVGVFAYTVSTAVERESYSQFILRSAVDAADTLICCNFAQWNPLLNCSVELGKSRENEKTMRVWQTNVNTNVCFNSFTGRERSREVRRNIFLQLS